MCPKIKPLFTAIWCLGKRLASQEQHKPVQPGGFPTGNKVSDRAVPVYTARAVYSCLRASRSLQACGHPVCATARFCLISETNIIRFILVLDVEWKWMENIMQIEKTKSNNEWENTNIGSQDNGKIFIPKGLENHRRKLNWIVGSLVKNPLEYHLPSPEKVDVSGLQLRDSFLNQIQHDWWKIH